VFLDRPECWQLTMDRQRDGLSPPVTWSRAEDTGTSFPGSSCSTVLYETPQAVADERPQWG
jgi:hypothetical protein